MRHKIAGYAMAAGMFTVIFGWSSLPCFAKRMPIPEVDPVTYDAMTLTAPAETMGVVRASDTETGALLWEKQIYEVPIDPLREPDVQWVYISRLEVRDHLLVITDEKRRVYILDLRTRQITQEEPVEIDIPVGCFSRGCP